MRGKSRRILFVTWDGPQVNYLEGLFLPIFAGLQERGHDVSVLQFGWGDSGGADAARQSGIDYHRVEVDRRLGALGAFVTAMRGGRAIDRAIAQWNIDLLLPRGMMPSLATLSAPAGRRLPILFDADGLPADERVEFGGLSRRGPTYLALRAIEARMVAQADHVLVRSSAGARTLAERGGGGTAKDKFTVVTNGRAPYPLPPMERSEGPPRLVYVGSFGRQYRPLDMLDLVKAIRGTIPGTTLAIFTGDRAGAAQALEQAGLADAEWISVVTLTNEELQQRLPQFDAGLALRADSLSMRAVAPIKIGDYLMAGLPIIGSAGIGDVGPLIDRGVMLGVGGADDADAASDWLRQRVLAGRGLRAEARSLGERLFSLRRSVDLYAEAIDRVPARTS